MTEFTGIAYEPHPVSPERKAELRAQGLRIIDIQFQPATPHEGDSPAIDLAPLEFTAEAPAQTHDGVIRNGRKPKVK